MEDSPARAEVETPAEAAAAAEPAAAAAPPDSLQELAAMAESLLARATELRAQTEALADELDGGPRPG